MIPEEKKKERFKKIVVLLIESYLDEQQTSYGALYALFGVDFGDGYEYKQNPKYEAIDKLFIPACDPYYNALKQFEAAISFVDEGSKEEKTIARKWEKQKSEIIDNIANQLIEAYPDAWK